MNIYRPPNISNLLFFRYGKVREGDNIFKFLKSRDQTCEMEKDDEAWKNGEILYIVQDNKKRDEINERKLQEFNKQQTSFTATSKDLTIDIDRQIPIPPNTPYTQTGYVPTSISVKQNAPIMLTYNHSNRKLREDGICNGNRGSVTRIDFSKKPGEENEIAVIWVELYDKSGLLYKEEMKRKKNLYHPNPYAIPILPVSTTFTLQKNRIKYRRYGFPLILGFCHTAHKIQVI